MVDGTIWLGTNMIGTVSLLCGDVLGDGLTGQSRACHLYAQLLSGVEHQKGEGSFDQDMEHQMKGQQWPIS